MRLNVYSSKVFAVVTVSAVISCYYSDSGVAVLLVFVVDSVGCYVDSASVLAVVDTYA